MKFGWPTTEPDVPLDLQNRGFRPPKPPGAFISLRVHWTTGDFLTIGSPGDNLVRREGLIWLYAYVPTGVDGIVRAHQLAAEGAAIFEGQNFEGVLCGAIAPGGPVESEDGNYTGTSCAIPFSFDEAA